MMVVLPPHRAFEVVESSQVGQVRRCAVQAAEALGFDEVTAGRVALLATELGNNLVRHAREGQLLLGAGELGGRQLVELLSVDRGPGIADLGACMADGYSTGGTPGTGLGAVRRLADEFDIYSAVPAGTVILARVVMGATPVAGQAPAAIEAGAVVLPAPGETVSGDGWALALDGGRASVLLADGLGHGPGAAEAAQAATAAFGSAPYCGPAQMIERAHALLRSTRGAAVAAAELNAVEGALRFAGAGNVQGRLLSALEERTLLSQHGTVGLQIRRMQDLHYPWPPHALLVLHSDGLASRWSVKEWPGLLQRHPSLVAAWLMRDHRRGRDDTAVVVLRRREP